MSNKRIQERVGKTMSQSTILALAVAGVLGVTQFASAQQRVDRSGANDANMRVGSNGRNDNRTPQPQPWQTNNAIVYGNVTGGKEFRGSLSTTDPTAFRGATAGQNTDNFVRNSAGVSTGGVATFNANQTRAYYGDSRGVAPPAGFTSGLGSVGGYTAPVSSAWRNVDPRIGSISSGMSTTLNRPDQFGAPGAMDMQYAPGAITASPYTSTQSMNPSTLSDYTQLNRTTPSALNPNDVAELRRQTQNAPADQQGATQQGGGQRGAGQINDAIAPNSLQNAGPSDAVRPGALNNGLTPESAVEPGIRSRVLGMAEQNSTYANLAARRAEQAQTMRPGQATA